MTTIGFVGLGNVGLPAATNLLRAGFHVVGYDLKPSTAFVDAGGRTAASLEEVASADTVIQSLPNPQALESCTDALLPHVRRGQAVVDLSSYPLEAKQASAERYAERGAVMLDCEISGLPPMVAARTAVIFKAGPEDAVDRLRPVFDGMTDKHFYLGAFGAATRMKLIANLMVCVHDLMAAEALTLGARAGLDPAQMIEVLAPSAAGSSTFAFKAPLMVSRAFDGGKGPFRHMFGYLERADALAREVGSATPLLHVARAVFGQAEAEGRHDQDIAAIIEIVERMDAAA